MTLLPGPSTWPPTESFHANGMSLGKVFTCSSFTGKLKFFHSIQTRTQLYFTPNGAA